MPTIQHRFTQNKTAIIYDVVYRRGESWTQSIAVGNRSYVESIKRQIGGNAIGRKIRELSKGFELREPEPVYNAFFWGKNGDIHSENGWH
jgi:hypothetical protein